MSAPKVSKKCIRCKRAGFTCSGCGAKRCAHLIKAGNVPTMTGLCSRCATLKLSHPSATITSTTTNRRTT